MHKVPVVCQQPPAPPRGIAVSGIIFSALYVASLMLLRLAVPADPTETGAGWRTVTFGIGSKWRSTCFRSPESRSFGSYADQSERDHEVLMKAVRAGKLEVFIEER